MALRLVAQPPARTAANRIATRIQGDNRVMICLSFEVG